jgi:hypothetical protein
VVGGGVGPGAALAQQQRQRLTGVSHQTSSGRCPKVPLKVPAANSFSEWAITSEASIADHDGLAQVGVAHPRRGNPAMPPGDQRPHILTGLRAHPGDPAPLRLAGAATRSDRR